MTEPPPASAAREHARGDELWLRIDDPTESAALVCVVGEGVIGRDYRCDVVIHDSEASRMHARVTPRESGGWVVADLATTNGTLVNSERIVGPARIALGDVITIGRVSCTVVRPGDGT